MIDMIKVPVADNVLPIVSDCGHLVVSGIIDGDYAYVPGHVLSAPHFDFAHDILKKYPVVQYDEAD